MCTVSMILDNWNDHWKQPMQPTTWPPTELSREMRIAQLERDVEFLKKQIESAKQYDAKTGQSDCESDEKIEKLKAIADLLDIDISDVIEILESP